MESTYQKIAVMRDAIAHLEVRDKRSIFLLMRTAADQLTVDTFFPAYGFTAGEFAVGQVLAEHSRKTTTTNDHEPKETKGKQGRQARKKNV